MPIEAANVIMMQGQKVHRNQSTKSNQNKIETLQPNFFIRSKRIYFKAEFLSNVVSNHWVAGGNISLSIHAMMSPILDH